MSGRLGKNLLKYGITVGVCLTFVAIFCFSRDILQQTLTVKYRILCDAFTVPGAICLCLGVLIWASTDGFFDGLTYCLSIAWRSMIPGGRATPPEKYYDYVLRKREKRATGFGFLFIVGGILMAFALLFMALFYRAYNG